MPTVTGNIDQIAGTAVTSGEVRFTATTPVVQDPNGKTTSLATSVAEHVVLLDGTGTFSTTLPATGDTWVYRVEISAYVGGNRVQGLPRLLLEVPATGADLSDAGVEGSPSGRVVVNRLVGRTELSAAVAPIQQAAENALTTAQSAEATADNAVGRVEELEILGGVAPGDPTDATIALHMQQPTSQTQAALNAQSEQVTLDTAEDAMGLVLAGRTFDFARLQAAAYDAESSGRRLVAAGSITTSQTLYLKCNVGLDGLTITYTGTGTAVEVGGTTPANGVRNLHGSLPRVIRSGNWDGGTIGIRMVNLNSCDLTVPHIQGFDIGLQMFGHNYGISYNLIRLGYLYNNKITQQLDRTETGWANENQFQNGRFAHNMALGTQLPGSTHIDLVNRPGNSINGNHWIKPSIEGNVPEYQAQISGSANIIETGRWEIDGTEYSPRVLFRSGSRWNSFFYGYGVQKVVEVYEDQNDPYAGANQVHGPNQMRLADYNRPVLVGENTNGGPILAGHFPGTRKTGTVTYDSAHGTMAAWTMSHEYLLGRAVSGERETMVINWKTGRFSFGPGGTTAPNMWLGRHQTRPNELYLENADLTMYSSKDIGLVDVTTRPRTVRARNSMVTGVHTTAERNSSAVVTHEVGKMVYDSDLNIPIWSDGQFWRNASGQTV